MSADLIALVSQNIGPLALSVSGFAGVSSGLLAYHIYRNKQRVMDEVDLRDLVPEWQPRDIARLFGALGGLPVRSLDESDVLDAIERASTSAKHIPIALPQGNIQLSGALPLVEHTQLVGRGTENTRIVSADGLPAITASGARDAKLCNIGVDGGIHCRESEVVMRDCEVRVGGACAGIDIEDGSVLTFSGRMITSPGTVAIRARSGSRVILEAPFEIQPSDQVVIEPGCEIVC